MIKKERIDWWDTRHKIDYQGQTRTNYLDNNLDLFIGKKVLEIGPGEGRQYNKVSKISADYYVMDISQKVLDNYPQDKTILINSYTPIEQTFDIVHFWYVIHHVIPEELEEFLNFVVSMSSGLIMFNAPYGEAYKNKGADHCKDDGMATSIHSLDKIESLLGNNVVRVYEKEQVTFIKDNSGR